MKPKIVPLVAFCFAALICRPLAGQTVARWDFNSSTPDNNPSTGSISPTFGSGSIAAVGGAAIQSSYQDGAAFAGSSDPVSVDNSALRIAGFPAQGTGSRTRGVEFAISTAGFSNIVFSFDQYLSGSSSAYVRVQYSIYGTNFTDMALSGPSTSQGLIFHSYSIEGFDSTWIQALSVDFSAITGAADNPDFKVRMLSEFQPDGSTYYPASMLSAYSTSVSNNYWAFDMVTVGGTAIPEPGAWTAVAGAVVLIAVFFRRRARTHSQTP